MGAGWWYSDATGVLSDDYRALLANTSEPVRVAQYGSVVKTSCLDALGEEMPTYDCYASQRLSSNANTRTFTVLTVERNTYKARFFQGSQYMLVGGKPMDVGTGSYRNLPDLSKH